MASSFRYLFRCECAKAVESVVVFLSLDDPSVLGENAAHHVSDDEAVIVDLGAVFGKQGPCDSLGRGSAAPSQQFTDHYRLVDMGHAHFLQEEPAQPLK